MQNFNLTPDMLAARMLALEVISLTAIGLYLSNSKNDPDYSKAAALIDHMRAAISRHAANLPATLGAHTLQYGEELLQTASNNLRVLRDEVGALN